MDKRRYVVIKEFSVWLANDPMQRRILPIGCDFFAEPNPAGGLVTVWLDNIEFEAEMGHFDACTRLKDPSCTVDEFNGIRGQLTEIQRRALSAIWQHRQACREWMPIRVLHHRIGKQLVVPALDELGGSIVLVVRENAKDRYRLTFLGVLLTDEGLAVERLLARYLEYVRDRFAANFDMSVVESMPVESALGLTAAESGSLRELIEIGGLWSGSASSCESTWSAGLPNDIEDFVDVQDFHDYLRQRAISGFDRALPLREGDRVRYAAVMFRPKSKFWFITDEMLRRQLDDDWREAHRVHPAEGWKSCVVLCGGILEGMLFDALRQVESAAHKARLELKGKDLEDLGRWRLADLVDVAEKLGLLTKGIAHLNHALREFRNLIHPARQLRLNITVTKDEADIAILVVKQSIKELSSTASLHAENS